MKTSLLILRQRSLNMRPMKTSTFTRAMIAIHWLSSVTQRLLPITFPTFDDGQMLTSSCTKSVNIAPLTAIEPVHNAIVAWSLTPQVIAGSSGSENTERSRRLEAAAKLQALVGESAYVSTLLS